MRNFFSYLFIGKENQMKVSALEKIITGVILEEFAPQSNSAQDSIWYHGSSQPIRKFKYSLVGKNSEKISGYHGHGIYFINDINRAKRYGDYITRVAINESANILKDNVTPQQLNLVYNQLVREGLQRPQDKEFFLKPTYGEYSVFTDVEEFYDFFLRAYRTHFKTIKDVSDFLLRAGIDGMQVVNDVGDIILVVFNEDIITVI